MSITDVVVDIETLGTRPGDSIVQIAGVGFDRNAPSFLGQLIISVSVPLAKSENVGTASTLDWWFNQSNAAQAVLLLGNSDFNEVSTSESSMLFEFMRQVKSTKIQKCCWWGNSHSFDLVLIEAALKKLCYEDKPWDFRKERCFRTLKIEMPFVSLPENTTTKHIAVNDAMYEAECLFLLLKALHG